MPVIIIEGMDSSGKTTLAGDLAKRLQTSPIPILGPKHCSGDYPQWLENQLYLWRGARVAGNYERVFLYERFTFISESIYGPVIRNYGNYDKLWFSWLDKILEEYPTFIYCRPPVHTMWDTLNNKEQMKGVEVNFARLVQAYDDFFSLIRRTSAEVFSYDWTRDGQLERVYNFIGR